MIWISYAVLVLSWLILFRTAIGLRIRSVGEHPRAADTVGISVYGIRYVSVVTSGGLAAMGGVFLSIGFVNSFPEHMTAGRTIIVARETGRIVLLDAAWAIPVAAVGGILALLFVRGARGRIRETLERAGGAGRIRAAKILAIAGICFALSGSIAVGLYELLLR